MADGLLIIALVAAPAGLIWAQVWPVARGADRVRAIVTWCLVAVPSTVQLFWPPLLPSWQRDHDAIVSGQYWRLLTSVVVQDGPGVGTVTNLILLAVVLAFAFSALRGWWPAGLLALFGVASNIADVWLRPIDGAGNSKATLALAAMLAGGAMTRFGSRNPLLLALPVLGVGLAVLGNNHGLPLVVGFLVGLIPGPWWREALQQLPAGPDVGQSGVAGADREP